MLKNTLPKLKKKAQETFNKWVRNRDAGKGCISCGGPIDHAWPSLLGQKFDIPTLNVSMGGLSFHYGQVIVDNYKKSFCVERVFVVYNLFDRDKITKDDLNIWRNYGIESKIKAFKEYCMIENAYWQFSPPWSF